MRKYSLHLSENIPHQTKIKVYELFEYGISSFEKYIQKIEATGNHTSDLAKLIRIIENSSNLLRQPETKFREIKGKEKKLQGTKLYEAKAGILRVYIFHEERTGRIIVTAGKKNDQTKDINNAIKTIQAYKDEQQK
ncbi:hypothetical protein [Myroides sp. N17-2]|uniref:hypothetical protein n=1 Tax=Myroides sp. N17-2 TaxID=2030799 RepID=UPI000EFAD645|nr:hypothetical protein [Myroides sp. N17-2]